MNEGSVQPMRSLWTVVELRVCLLLAYVVVSDALLRYIYRSVNRYVRRLITRPYSRPEGSTLVAVASDLPSIIPFLRGAPAGDVTGR